MGEFFDQSPRQQDDPAIRERERPHLGAVEALLLPAPRRVASVDALRGFTTFWIMGADGAAKALAEMLSGKGTITCGRLSRPRTTAGTPPPRTAVARLRRISRPATDRRLCERSDVPIENPWHIERPALSQGALSVGADARRSRLCR